MFSLIYVCYLCIDLYFISIFSFIDSIAIYAFYYHYHYIYIVDVFIAIQIYVSLNTCT